MKELSTAQPVVRNMGIYWKKDDVFWGKQNSRGQLWGKLRSKKKAREVDFWDQVGIYALYKDFRLVYVGQAGKVNSSLGLRLRHWHHELPGRWDLFSWFGLRYVKRNRQLSSRFETRQVTLAQILNVLEGICLEVADPPLNAQSARFGDSAEEYMQVRAERLEPQVDIPRAIGELNRDVKALTRQLRSTRTWDGTLGGLPTGLPETPIRS